MKDKRLFISQNPGGIGNRVRNMVSGMMDANSWASFSSLDNWRVFWVDGWHSCGEKNKKNKFTDLFDMAPYQVTDKEIELFKENKKEFSLVGKWWWRTPRKYLKNPNNKLPKHNLKELKEQNKRWTSSGVDFLYDRTPQEIIEIIAPYFEQVKFNPQIKKAADDFFSKNFNDRDIAIQIRSWVEPIAFPRRGLFDIDAIVNAINHYPNSKVYISTDSPAPALELMNLISNQVIMNDFDYNKDNEFIDSRLDQRTWIKDMLILSRFNTLILPSWSTFGEMSFWIGGAQAKTIIV
jgi:hypothetical protein